MRKLKNTPFCWQEKSALRKIREACGNVGDGASTLATYLALTEIASDHQSDRFETTHEYISGKACLSIATVKRKLKLLAEIGLVSITIPAIRAPGTYELLRIAHGERSIGHSERSIAHGSKRVRRATLEESPEESKKKEKIVPIPDIQSWRDVL